MPEIDSHPDEPLLVLVYDELRGLAARQLASHDNGNQTLQATALVHEAWLRLSGSSVGQWNDRTHFFRAAAMAMRRILVDRARQKCSQKRSGTRVNLDWADDVTALPESDSHILMVDECLEILEHSQPECAKIVQLKFFAGLSNQEIADMIGTSLRSVERHWAFARVRLYQMVQERNGAAGAPK